MKFSRMLLFLIFCHISPNVLSQDSPLGKNNQQSISHHPIWRFDEQLQKYFHAHTLKIKTDARNELEKIEDWASYQKDAKAHLLDMLGMNPMPTKTPLEPVITGTIEHEEFIIEKLYFQSMPGLYVTANLYIPKKIEKPLPAILYVCGHANVVEDGISYGSKVNYQHHPAWFARNGYVCLIIDTFQLGEIEGIHHGTYRYDRWWWLSRGYTPAGVETWNCIRSLDYLISRPEVDAEKLGVTGRSGGGVYSWWLAAVDDRIKVSVPVAGITDMENYVIDGCVEGHCDCMFMVNTYGWDYTKVAALIAPRPLLISNTDRDPIFPLSGVYRTFHTISNVYEQLGARDDVALQITAGPHHDTQELRVHAFRWFNHYLRGTDELIDKTAVKYFTPQELKVFDQLPEDEINTRIDEYFVPKAKSTGEILASTSWDAAKESWKQAVEEQIFDKWEKESPAVKLLETHETQLIKKLKLDIYELQSDAYTKLPIFRLSVKKKPRKRVKIIILDDENWGFWRPFIASVTKDSIHWDWNHGDGHLVMNRSAQIIKLLQDYGQILFVSMRGAGPARYSGDERKQIQIRRRFYLLGQSLESLQTLDMLQAIEAMPSLIKGMQSLQIKAKGQSANMLIYASLFSGENLNLELENPTLGDKDVPPYLNISKYMDMEAAVMLAAEKHELSIFLDKAIPDYEQWGGLGKLINKYQELRLKIE